MKYYIIITFLFISSFAHSQTYTIDASDIVTRINANESTISYKVVERSTIGTSTIYIEKSNSTPETGVLLSDGRLYFFTTENLNTSSRNAYSWSTSADGDYWILTINWSQNTTGDFFGTPNTSIRIHMGNATIYECHDGTGYFAWADPLGGGQTWGGCWDGPETETKETIWLEVYDPRTYTIGTSLVGDKCNEPTPAFDYSIGGLTNYLYDPYLSIELQSGATVTRVSCPTGGNDCYSIDRGEEGIGDINGKAIWDFPAADFMNLTTSWTYEYPNDGSYTKIGSIRTPPSVNAGIDVAFCASGGEVTLLPVTTGGVWSDVDGYVDASGNFNTDLAPAGTHIVSYTITDANNCTNTDTKLVTIHALPTITANNQSACKNSGLVALNASPTGGTWSGSTHLDGSSFNTGSALAGDYTLTYTFTNANGCTNTRDITFTVHELPTPGISADGTAIAAGGTYNVCKGENVALEASGGSAYSWSPSTYLSDDNIANPVITGITTSTTYTVTVTNSNGCVRTQGIAVNVLENTTGAVTNPTVYTCANEGVQLQASGGSAYSWSPTTGLNDSNVANPIATVSSDETYTVTITDNNGCTKDIDVDIIVNDAPTVTLSVDGDQVSNGENFNLCSGSSAQLNAEGTNATSFLWSPTTGLSDANIKNPIATPTATTTYTVTVTNSDGCESTKSAQITVVSLPSVNAGTNETHCLNDGSVTLTGSPTGGTWSTTSSGLSGSTFTFATAGVGSHTLRYTYTSSTTGCTNYDEKIIEVTSIPTADAGSDMEVCSDNGLIILGNSGVWTAPNGITESDGIYYFDPSIGAGDFTLTLIETSGSCSNTDTKIITVNAIPTVEAGNNLSVCINTEEFTLKDYSPTGGVWSGDGLIGPTLFDPADAGLGTHTLTYSYSDDNGCTNSDQISVVVNDISTIEIGSDMILCKGSSVYNLNTDLDVEDRGGVWSGTGVSGNNFDPSDVNSGSYTITYTYTNASGCISTQTKEITVLDGPTVDAGTNVSTCSNSDAFNLIDGTPVGGTWSGIGITDGTNGTFDPSEAGAGNHLITYSYDDGSCTATDTKYVTVNAPTNIDAGSNLSKCENNPDFLLTGASVSGGTWSGTGVSGNYFSPASAGPGTHIVTYTYENGKGCESSDTRNVVVSSKPVVDAGLDISICLNADIYSLSDDVNIEGGYFTGNGVSGLNFNPSTAGKGTHQITYTYTNTNGCSESDFRYITVIEPATITVGSNVTTCIDSTPFDISGSESISGGTWNGNGLTGTTFSPATAGKGSHTLTYTVADGNGCETSGTRIVTVKSLPVVEAGQDIYVCNSVTTVSLSGTGSPAGGVWSGDYVTGNYFDITASGSGTHEITYTYTDPDGCVNSGTKNVVVDAGTTVSAGPDFSVCSDDGLIDLASRVTPGGGTFFGPGITDKNFDPSIGAGSYTITYSVTNGYGCTGSDNFVIAVYSIPTVFAGTDATMCENEDQLDLSLTASPVGGYFTGAGINGNIFNPADAGVGTHLITYTYTNASGCSAVDYREIEVTSPPLVDAGSNNFICIDADIIDLDATANKNGGNSSWSGPGVNNGLFDPLTAGVGTHTVTMTVNFNNGCQSTDSRTIKVFEELEIDAGSDVNVCFGGGLIDLNQGASVSSSNWSGTGVTGSTFDTSIGTGNYTVILTYTNSYGCSDTDSKVITVLTPETVSVGSDRTICETAPEIDLNESVSPLGGTFTGSGVSSGYFYPDNAGTGIHKVTYTYVDVNGCEIKKDRTFTVTDPPAINAGANIVTCFSSDEIDLDLNAVDKGGVWSGIGVSGGFFNSSEAGTGTHAITYTIDHGNGCISIDNISVSVREDITVDAGSDLTVCENGSDINLNNEVSKTGGTWSGSVGIKEGLLVTAFDPELAGPGLHSLLYTYENIYGCEATDTKTITVLDANEITIGEDRTVCTTADPINLNTSVYPTGGTWSGSIAISGSLFDPSKVSAGNHIVTYSITNANGCTTKESKIISVKTPEPVDAGENLTICENSNLVDLSNLPTIKGGNWSGTAVSSNIFDPAAAGIGSFTLTYIYNDGSGCISTDKIVIIVKETPFVDAGENIEACVNENDIDLTFESNVQGGTWFGNGISGNIFSPSNAGTGPHNIIYEYVDSYGCTATDVKVITVRNTEAVNAGPSLNVCTTSGPVDLDSSVDPQGGLWSGPAVSGNQIDPSLLDPGAYDITYSYTNEFGCTESDIKIVNIELPEEIDAGSDITLCISSERIALNNDVSIKGGTWSGNGIVSGYFYPDDAGIGIHTLKYSYSYGNGCVSEAIKMIEVIEDPLITISDDVSVCLNNNSIDLTSYATPTGGTWSGGSVSNNMFDPSVAGKGTHTITYSFTNGYGCSSSKSLNIVVNELPSVDAGPEKTVCTTAGTVDLSLSVSPSGGTWSGSGVNATNNTFDPALVGAGSYNLVYTYTNASGCANSDTRRIIVENPPTIDAGNNLVVCVDSEKRDLDLDVSVTGGTWSGSTALDGSFFDPSMATAGQTYILTYTYDDGFGCISTDNRSVQVRAAVTVDAGENLSFCANDTEFNLTGQANKSGGTWSGNGIVEGKFNPVTAGVGSHVITYSYQDPYGCLAMDTKTVTVNGIPAVDAGTAETEVCTTAGLVDLTLGVSPSGGTWSGSGVDASANTFNPAQVGEGSYNLTYTYTNANGCSNSDVKTYVVENPPSIDAGANLVLCVDSEKRDLDLDVSVTGGTWSGSTALDGSFFDPSMATAGQTYILTYTYDDGFGCISTDNRSVQVRAAVTVDAGEDLSFCTNDLAFDLTGEGSKSGGTWSGNGITDGKTFTAATAGVGSHVITYTYQDPYGCLATDTKTVTVNGIPAVDAGTAETEVCTTAGLIDLTLGVSPSGGTWSGSGVDASANTFNPAQVGEGSYNLTYTYTNANGCSNSDVKTYVVENPPSIDAGANLVLCVDSEKRDLDLDVSVTGGTWSGSTALDGSFFDPSMATAGQTYILTYTYDDGFGCISTDNRSVQVRAAVTVDAGEDLSFCTNDLAFDLTGEGSKSGGTWSGNGITDGKTFTAATAGVGSHVITYTYQDPYGCLATDTKTVTVNGIPAVDAGTAETEVCTTAGLIDLTLGVSPSGGTWSGSGVDASANTFNPAQVGEGSYNLTYTYTNANGCSNSDVKTYVVENPPSIDAGANLVLCVDSEKRDLDLDVSVTGGTWSGSTALDGSFFDPSMATAGQTYILTYTYDDGFGCISTDNRSVQVRAAVTVDAGEDLSFCTNDLAFDLTGEGSKSGGTWSGNGITDGKTFTAATAGVGSHVITYTYQDPYGCLATDTKTVTVNGIPAVDAGTAETEVCTTAGLIDLTLGVSPSGGTWSGSGVDASANTFNPAQVGAGSYNLTYTYTNANGCSNSDVKTYVVENPPSIDAGANLVLCVDSEKRDLDLDVSVTGGTWSGSTALDGSFFDPSMATAGQTYILTYTYDDGFGCISTDNRSVQVRSAVTVDAGEDLSFCVNDLAFDLTGEASKSGGTWSGNGITDGKTFTAATAVVGSHVITYTYQDPYGCLATDTKTVTVNGIPAVDAGTAETEVCTTAGLVDLTLGVSPSGGTWSGSGVDATENTFNPAQVGEGSYSLTYTYTNENGCSNSDVKTYVVENPPSIDAGENIILCIDSDAIDLDLEVSITGGEWSGSEALDGSYFDASLAGLGTHLLTYTYDDGLGCISSDVISVQVKSAIVVNAGDDFTMCVNENPIELSDVDKTGGEWSGQGIDEDYFDPELAGEGSHTLTYTYSNNYGCIATDTRVATVIGLPDVSAGSDIDMCITDGERDLTNDVYPAGGVFKGPSVIGNVFNPTAAGAGTHTITYTYTDENGCSASDTKTIVVNKLPVVDAGNDFEVCINASPIVLTAISEGGSWSGTGIISGEFDPLSAGLGEHKLVYSLVNEQNCLNTDTIMVKVLEEPELYIGEAFEICVTSTPINIASDVSMNGGTFSGNGIVGNLFNPQEAGVGIHIISYTVRYNGCELTEFREIIVNEATTVDIGPDLTLCTDSEPVNLILDLNESVSGTFQGAGVSNNMFYADAAGLGSHIIEFTYENAFGCITNDQRIISVQDQIPVFAGADIDLCNNISSYDLSGLPSPSGGLFVGPGVTNNVFDATAVGPGAYTIEYVYEFTNNCVSTDQLIITVKENNVEGIDEDIIVCINDSPVDLTQGGQLSGRWVGTGVVNNKFYPALAASGEFDLIYTDDTQDCDIAGIRKVTVVNLPKAPNAEQITFTGCSGDFIELVAKVNPEDVNTNITIAWFEDLNAETHYALGEKLVHQINEVNETVYFRGMNSFGCYSNESGYMEIFTENPTGEIEASDTIINFGYSVQLFATNTKNVKSYRWDFGDGLTSYNKNPYHYYYEADTFDILLELTSANGCISTIERPKMIRVLPEPGRDEDDVMGVNNPNDIGGYENVDLVLRAYPNPVALNETMSIEINASKAGSFIAKAINVDGKSIVLKETVFINEGYNVIELPVKTLSIGYHIIVIENESNRYQVKVVIK